MIRTIKALGLAVGAMLAIGALGAPAAQAEATNAKITVPAGVNYPISMTSTAPAGTWVLETEAGKLDCALALSGTVSEASKWVVMLPQFSGCKAFGFLSATVLNDNCEFAFEITTKTGVDSYQAHFSIVGCNAGAGITITASTCKVTIPAQTGLTTVDIENMTNTPTSVNDLTYRPTVTGITYNVTTDDIGCPFDGPGHRSNGRLESTSVITTTAEEKGKTTPVEIHVG